MWFCASKSISCFNAWYLHMIAPWLRKQFDVNFPQKDFSKATLTWQSKLSSEPLTRKLVCSDDLKQQWWRLVKWWLRVVLMTLSQLMSLNDDFKERWSHFSWVMFVSDVENPWWNDEDDMVWTVTSKRTNFLLFQKNESEIVQTKNKARHKYFEHSWSLFELSFFATAKFLHLFSFRNHLDWNRSCVPHNLKLRRSFISHWLNKKMKLCYLAGAVTLLKRFNKFIYFESLPMKKGSYKCWKIHVFKLKSSRLVSRKLQKTRTSVMISSRMFGIFVINEAIENTCNLLKNRCLQSMIMSFAQVTTSNDDDDFHGVMTTDEPWMMSSVSTDEWWVMTSVSTDEQCRTNTRSCWNCQKSK